LATTVITSGNGLSCKIPHFEGEEVFGSCKRQLDLRPRLDSDSHQLDKVNFFVPKLDTHLV